MRESERVSEMSMLPVENGRCGADGLLVLGIGNTLVTDDGAGIYAARLVREMAEYDDIDVEVAEASSAGLSLAVLMSGYGEVIIADAIMTQGGVPGTVYEMDFADFMPSYHLVSQHGVDIFTAVEMARKCGMDMPGKIRIIGIEIEDNVTVGEGCTPRVRRAVDAAARKILGLINKRECHDGGTEKWLQ